MTLLGGVTAIARCSLLLQTESHDMSVDLDAFWVVNSGWPKELVLDRGANAPGKGASSQAGQLKKRKAYGLGGWVK